MALWCLFPVLVTLPVRNLVFILSNFAFEFIRLYFKPSEEQIFIVFFMEIINNISKCCIK